jgi:hypothetical protein
VLYVEPDELGPAVGRPPDDTRVVRVCQAASTVVDAYYGSTTVAAKLRNPDGSDLDTVPAVVAEAALTIATDLYRRPTTPGGYFSVADYVGRLAQDPAAPVVVLLDALGREAWPVA